MMGVDFIPKKIFEKNPQHHPQKLKKFKQLEKECLNCTKCSLHKSRTNVVFGVGNIDSPIVFVGEAPGEEEDKKAEPFVGRAGQYLTQTLRRFGVKREQVYIGNVIKCRPPGNRTPTITEITTCVPYLWKQLRIINPKVVCALGNVAAATLLDDRRTNISLIRGRYFQKNQFTIFPIFHPSYIVRNMSVAPVFEADLKKVLKDVRLA
jgi:DNA polymerase